MTSTKFRNLKDAFGDMLSPMSDATGLSRRSSRRNSNVSDAVLDISFNTDATVKSSRRSSRTKAEIGKENEEDIIPVSSTSNKAPKARRQTIDISLTKKSGKKVSDGIRRKTMDPVIVQGIVEDLNEIEDTESLDLTSASDFSLLKSANVSIVSQASTKSTGKRNYSTRSPATAALKNANAKISQSPIQNSGLSCLLDDSNTYSSGASLNLSTVSVDVIDARRNTIDPSTIDAILQSINDDDIDDVNDASVASWELAATPRLKPSLRRESVKAANNFNDQVTPPAPPSRRLSGSANRIDRLKNDTSALNYLLLGLDDSVSTVASGKHSRRNSLAAADIDDQGNESPATTTKRSPATSSSILLAKKNENTLNLLNASDSAMSISLASEVSLCSTPGEGRRITADQDAIQAMLQALDAVDSTAELSNVSYDPKVVDTSIASRRSLRSSRSPLSTHEEIKTTDRMKSSKSLNKSATPVDPKVVKAIMQSIEKDIPYYFHGDVEAPVTPAEIITTKSKSSSKSKNSRNSIAGSQKKATDAMSPLTPGSIYSKASSSCSITEENEKWMNVSSADREMSGPSPRRMTVDTNDLEHFMAELDEEHNKVQPSDRRMTADACDMAQLLANIDEDGTDARVSMLSLNMSDFSTDAGRESIDTIELLKNVNSALQKNTNSTMPAPNDNDRQSLDTCSTISNLSFKSDNFSIGSEIDARRMTADVVELQDLVQDLTEHTGVGSVNTMELMVAVQDVLHTVGTTDSPTTLDPNKNTTKSSDDSFLKERTFSSPMHRTSGRLSKDEPSMMESPSMNLSQLINTGLKSCMSTKKSARKSVVFGSPKAVEFVRDSKTSSFTPMSRQDAKAMFPITQEESHEEQDDDATSENSRILEEWDRLTNTSGGSDSEDEFSIHSTPVSVAASSPKSTLSTQSPKSRRRRKSMLQPVLNDIEPTEESFVDEPTVTVNLPGSLGELLACECLPDAADNSLRSTRSADDMTENLETDLHSLIDKIGCTSFIATGRVSDSGDSTTASSVNVSNNSLTSKAQSDNSLGGLIGFEQEDQVDDNEAMDSPASASTVSFDFNKRRATLTAARTSYEPMDCGSPLSPMVDDDEVSFKIDKNRNCSKRLSKISNDSYSSNVQLAAADDVENAPSNSTNSSPGSQRESVTKKFASFYSDDCETADLETNLDNMLADFEENLAQNPEKADLSASCCSEASTLVNESILQEQEVEMSVRPSVGGGSTPLLTRLKNLNANARRTTLSHCQTPLGATSRLSIGIKRQSIARSANKQLSQNQNIVDETVAKRSKIQRSAKKSPAKKTTAQSIAFTSIISNIQSFQSKAQIEHDFVSVLQRGLQLLGNDTHHQYTIDSDIKEVLLGAIGEANLSSFSNKALDEQWSQLSRIMDPDSVLEVFNNIGPAATIEGIAASCVDNINGKYKVWEARLLEISADAVVQKAEDIREELMVARYERIAMEQEANKLDDLMAPLSTDSVEAELFELQTKIRQTREALEKSNDEVLEVGEAISELLKTKQNILSVRVGSSADRIAVAEEEAELIFAEKRIQLENLKLSTDAVNKMTWCSMTALTTTGIGLSAILSECFKIDINFALKQVEGAIIVDYVTMDLDIDMSSADVSLCQQYYETVLCDEQSYGILTKGSLKKLNSISDIKAFMRTISGHVSTFRCRNPHC